MIRQKIEMTGVWEFRIDPENRGFEEKWYQNPLTDACEVRLPHTVNVQKGYEEYRGAMWYAYRFMADEKWRGKRVTLQFGGIYRDADFWMNGIHIGSHMNSGFSPFTVDCGDTVMAGYENRLVIRVDNSYAKEALPIDKSFDWADDGGIFRPAYMLVTEQGAIESVHIDALPHIVEYGKRMERGEVELHVVVQTFLAGEKLNATLQYRIYDEQTLLYTSKEASLIEPPAAVVLPDMELWHFDNPKLYRAVLTIRKQGQLYDEYEVSFGCREFTTDGYRYVLNGEYVRLAGTEWMPGSNPNYGNAEPVEYIAKILQQLKESNCVFTRFHWQQDDAVYDWCDRHGMLVQEEIPNWGGMEQGAWQIMISRQQAEEMVRFHGNHPSIIAWGIGNELRGQEEQTKRCLREVLGYVRMIDPHRLIHYVSNTVWTDPAEDASALGDSLWANEYIGTWVKDLNVYEELDKTVKAHPEKPLVISEFGLCEPVFPGGDPERIQIFKEKMEIYRKYPQIAASVNFCLNDYRTQMGEEGTGALRRRVHGSTDLYGQPKPSYYVVQKECAPLIAAEEPGRLVFRCRKDLPAYIVQGYVLQMEGKSYPIDTLRPGEEWSISWNGLPYTLVRPTGDLVLEK